MTCCASVPDCRLLFVAGTSGTITIYNTVFNQAKVVILKKSNKESASEKKKKSQKSHSALKSEHQLTSPPTRDCFLRAHWAWSQIPWIIMPRIWWRSFSIATTLGLIFYEMVIWFLKAKAKVNFWLLDALLPRVSVLYYNYVRISSDLILLQ